MNATIFPIKKAVPQIDATQDFVLCDKKADESAKKLASYICAIPTSNHILFGHQNDRHCKAGERQAGFCESDVEDLCAEAAAVMGIDALSLTGDELGKPDWKKEKRIESAVLLSQKAFEDGSVLTLSAHMPNFSIVLEKGGADYSGYSPNVLSGNVVQNILKDTPIKALFDGYLDLVSDYLNALAKKNIALIWRPFHENTGFWFWWGESSCTPDEFKALWRYTWQYMSEKKGVHNVIWAYSPGSENKSESDFLERYPGDEFVDLLGFDMYQNYSLDASSYWEGFEEQLSLISSIAQKRKKLFANTETGIMRPENKALLESGNEKNWYSRVAELCLKYKASYFLLWANFGKEKSFYTPYATKRAVNEKGEITFLSGHELIDDFIDFHNDERILFAHETPYFK